MSSSSSPYNEAGKLLHEILTKHVSLKTASFGTHSKSSKNVSCSKSAYAQVSNTLLYKSSIDSILNHDDGTLRKLIQWDTIHNKALIYILLYELLFGKYHSIRGGGRLKRMIMQHAILLTSTRDLILSPHISTLIGESVAGTATNALHRFPRYVRVNTLRASTDEVVASLKQELRSLHSTNPVNACIFADPIVPNLLVLSPLCSLDWTRHALISSGKIVLQDKSSCFSALALVHGRQHHPSTNTNESIEGDFIDACAAPGNKCQHLAALVAQRHVSSTLNKPPLKSRIFALDKSGPRIKILKERMEQFKAEESSSTVEIIPIHQDFLKINPCDSTYAHVKSILLDPSCSGSGIVNTPDRRIEGENDKNQERIQALANFQLLALKHAMSFPQVCRIVYSTCSIHEEENEEVVCHAMEEMNRNIKEEDMKWVIVSPYALRQWYRRGHSIIEGITQDQADSLIRVDGSDGDETNGFFVCYFERSYLNRTHHLYNDETESMRLPPFIDGWYEGQFSNVAAGTEGQVVDHDSRNVADHDSCQKQPMVHTESLHHSVDKSARKREKKLEWKRKQKQRRLERLKSRGT